MTDRYSVDKKNKVRQLRENADYDASTVHAVVDAGLVAAVGGNRLPRHWCRGYKLEKNQEPAMITPPKPDDNHMRLFTEKPDRQVRQIWGAPLILGVDDKLHFKESGSRTVKLTVTSPENEFVHEIDLKYTAEQLCTTYGEIDLVFRINDNNELLFDQDHEDNGAPSNGGGTDTGQ